MFRWQRRYAPVPWSEIQPSDLRPMGDPETSFAYRREVHLGLVVKGEAVPFLGVLAIRCGAHGATLEPLSLSIADGTLRMSIDDGQSNPRRHLDAEDSRY